MFKSNIQERYSIELLYTVNWSKMMNYKYLREWVNIVTPQNLVFKELLRYTDQYIINFKKCKTKLQISLASEGSFAFFCEKSILPFKSGGELRQFNDNLVNSRLEKISISDTDRIINLHFSKIDIYNKRVHFVLLLELIPRFMNMILCDESKHIIYCLKKVTLAENSHRQVLPGVDYVEPPSGYKNDFGKVAFPLDVIEGKIVESSENGSSDINAILKKMLYDNILEKRVKQKRVQALRQVQKQINKKQKKIAKLQMELLDAEQMEHWKQLAELLKGSFTKLKSGMEKISLVDYYVPEMPTLEIKLDPAKTGEQNVDYYFKKYRKARDGKIKIAAQITRTHNEIEELEKELFEIDDHDFLADTETRKSKPEKRGYKKISIDENWEIFIGRTSSENDTLTTRFAKPWDWWFHTRIFRGTHIILRNYNKKKLPENLKFLCCRLAAYYSKAKKSSNIPVDFTQIRYVRKPRGATPGYVIYTNQKTIYVDPLSRRDAVELLK